MKLLIFRFSIYRICAAIVICMLVNSLKSDTVLVLSNPTSSSVGSDYQDGVCGCVCCNSGPVVTIPAHGTITLDLPDEPGCGAISCIFFSDWGTILVNPNSTIVVPIP